MPAFSNRTIIEAFRSIKVSVNLEVLVTRCGLPGPQPRTPAAAASSPHRARQELARTRQSLREKESELGQLRAEHERANSNGESPGGIRPENLIWIFGVARTGSTWLSKMMRDLDDHAQWDEPYVGDVFGYAYYLRAGDQMRARKQFVLSSQYKDVWLRSIRNLVLDGANARYPELADGGYLVIKEPNGSTGAPLLTEALPESRVILLVRDPRDVVASLLAANKKGSWAAASGALDPGADSNPDEFVWQRANLYMQSILKAREGYENHGGPKTVVRYEDLRYNAFGELKRVYAGIGIPVEDDHLRRVVGKHDWENVPEKLKGADKPRRKAKPGGYTEDLTPEQVRIVEDVTGPILQEFYSERETIHDPSDDVTPRE